MSLQKLVIPAGVFMAALGAGYFFMRPAANETVARALSATRSAVAARSEKLRGVRIDDSPEFVETVRRTMPVRDLTPTAAALPPAIRDTASRMSGELLAALGTGKFESLNAAMSEAKVASVLPPADLLPSFQQGDSAYSPRAVEVEKSLISTFDAESGPYPEGMAEALVTDIRETLSATSRSLCISHVQYRATDKDGHDTDVVVFLAMAEDSVTLLPFMSASRVDGTMAPIPASLLQDVLARPE